MSKLKTFTLRSWKLGRLNAYARVKRVLFKDYSTKTKRIYHEKLYFCACCFKLKTYKELFNHHNKLLMIGSINHHTFEQEFMFQGDEVGELLKSGYAQLKMIWKRRFVYVYMLLLEGYIQIYMCEWNHGGELIDYHNKDNMIKKLGFSFVLINSQGKVLTQNDNAYVMDVMEEQVFMDPEQMIGSFHIEDITDKLRMTFILKRETLD